MGLKDNVNFPLFFSNNVAFIKNVLEIDIFGETENMKTSPKQIVK